MKDPNGRKRRWRWLIPIVLLAGLLAYMYWPGGAVTIVVSPETTVITSPLNADGTPNYVAWMDANCSAGVTTENNAAPLLLRAIGPDMLYKATKDEVLHRLGLPADFPDRDKHFVSWEDRALPEKPITTAASQPGKADDGEAELDQFEVYDLLKKGKVHPQLAAWLAQNAQPFELIRQASLKPRLYVPTLSRHVPAHTWDAVVCGVMSLDHASEALAMRARARAAMGDIDGAWDDVLTIHRLAVLADQLPSAVAHLTAIGHIEYRAAHLGRRLATRYPMTADQANRILHELNALRPLSNGRKAFDRNDRVTALDWVSCLSQSGGTLPASFLSPTTHRSIRRRPERQRHAPPTQRRF